MGKHILKRGDLAFEGDDLFMLFEEHGQQVDFHRQRVGRVAGFGNMLLGIVEQLARELKTKNSGHFLMLY